MNGDDGTSPPTKRFAGFWSGFFSFLIALVRNPLALLILVLGGLLVWGAADWEGVTSLLLAGLDKLKQ
jgi:hypothetical protein